MIYDKLATGYEKALAPFERWFLDKWRSETLGYLPENSKILEIGAGTGLNFKHYPVCKLAVASDISIKMLEIATGKKSDIKSLQADAEKLPFPDNSFDAAFATLVFCSIPKPEKAFAELCRVLKAKDKIILLEHVRPNGLPGFLFDVFNIFTVALFKDYFNRETAEIAARAGLEVLEVKRKAFGIVNLIVCEVRK
jgi:ubiquinone/menaquinone biosynthesis C-methylase UbiE